MKTIYLQIENLRDLNLKEENDYWKINFILNTLSQTSLTFLKWVQAFELKKNQ